MSRGNVEALRQAYADWARGDVFRRYEFYSEDIEARFSPKLAALGGGVFHGLEEFGRGMAEFLQAWKSYRTELEELHEAGDRVVALVRQIGESSQGRGELVTRNAHLWTFRDGKAVRWEVFDSWEEGLAAAGLAPGGHPPEVPGR